jgi:hypothetical protein
MIDVADLTNKDDPWLDDERTATLYQVIGSLSDAAGVFEDPAVIRALDLAAYGKTEDGKDVLPFAPEYPAPSLPTREEVLAELVRGVCEACQTPAVGDGGGMLACGCHNTWRPRTVYERTDAILALFAQPQEKKT